MQDRYTVSATALTCLTLLIGGAVGCDGKTDDDTAVATTTAETEPTVSDRAASEESSGELANPADEEEAGEVAQEPVHPDEAADEIADAEREADRPVVDDALARRHIGAWIAEGGELQGSQFIFTDSGHAQMGTRTMMFSGQYTIDHSDDMAHLHISVDVMGRTVDTHFLVEYLPDDQLRFHPAAIDPEAPGTVRKQSGAKSLLMVRNE